MHEGADVRFVPDSPLQGIGFEPSVPPWLGAFMPWKTSMSGWVGVRGFEKGEFEGNRATEKVAAHRRARADPVELRANEIDEVAKIRIVLQRDPLGVDEVVR